MVRIAAIQMVSSASVQDNLEQASQLLAQAAAGGIELAVLPENFALYDTPQMLELGRAEVESPLILPFLQQQALEHRMWIVGGSVPLADRPDGSTLTDRVRSTCWVVDSTGTVAGRYDKIHLFDVDVQDAQGRYQESRVIEPGDAVTVIETPFGRLGVAICYDLRFPELFRQFQAQGVDVVALPAAFTEVTGAAHWHVLLRARAIENQCYVIAADQGGRHSPTRETFGHSLVVDPWGQVLAEQAKLPGVVVAELDQQRLNEIRRSMPVRAHRRLT